MQCSVPDSQGHVAVNKPGWSLPQRVYTLSEIANCNNNDFFSAYCICDSCSAEET